MWPMSFLPPHTGNSGQPTSGLWKRRAPARTAARLWLHSCASQTRDNTKSIYATWCQFTKNNNMMTILFLVPDWFKIGTFKPHRFAINFCVIPKLIWFWPLRRPWSWFCSKENISVSTGWWQQVLLRPLSPIRSEQCSVLNVKQCFTTGS